MLRQTKLQLLNGPTPASQCHSLKMDNGHWYRVRPDVLSQSNPLKIRVPNEYFLQKKQARSQWEML